MKFGRKKPIAHRYGLRLGNYIDPSAIDLPESTTYANKAMPCLDEMLGNDSLSDCTSAMCFHIQGVLGANAGRPVKFSNEQAIHFYSATTGYVPGEPNTDQGGNEVDVLNYWKTHGLYKGSHRIVGHATVDAMNVAQIKSALYLFENCGFGVSLPDAWVNPMPSTPGFTWDVAGAPVDENGHAFAGVDYNQHGVTIDTWGMLGLVTWRAIAKYAVYPAGGELHVVFSEDAINKASKKAPNGFSSDELAADFRKFTIA